MSDTSLNKIIQYGTAAARAAFTPAPPSSSKVLYMWYDTDAAPDLYVWNGSAWVLINAHDAVVKIAESTPTGNTVTFSSLGTYTHLHVMFSGRSDQAATSTVFDGTINADGGANYDRQMMSVVNTTLSGTESIGQTVINQIGVVSGANAPAGSVGVGDIWFFDYRGTTFRKKGTSRLTWNTSDASGGTVVRNNGFTWRSTAAITSITFTLQSAANFVSGTKFSLYGIA